jgi:hypothetical protein
MYNSKYSGATVEALLDAVSGKTIYTQGSGITIEGGSISVDSALTSDFVSNERFESLEEVVAQALISGDTPDMSGYYTSAQTDTLLAAKQDTLVSGTNIKTINNTSILGEGNIEISGGGSIDEDMYNGLQKAVAKILTDQKAKNNEIDANLAARLTMSEAEAQFVNNSELEAALVAFMRSDAYHAIHDPQEHAIAAGLNDLDSRVTTLEQDSGGSTPVDLSAYYTSAETLNQIGIASAATMTAVSQAIENEHYLTSADTQNYLTSADTVNFITSADTQDFVTETRFESLEETVANFMEAIPEESLVTTADTQNFITSADTQSFATTAVTSSLETRIAALEALLLVTGVNSAYTVVQMTEAEYSAATKNANTIYYVTSGATA